MIAEHKYLKKKKVVNMGCRNNQVGRPKKNNKPIKFHLSENIVIYFQKYRKIHDFNYSGSEHAEELIHLGLAFKILIPLLLTDRSDAEIKFFISQIPELTNSQFLIQSTTDIIF